MIISLKTIYNKLYSFYGPQGWWPVMLDNSSRIRRNEKGYHPDSPVFKTSETDKYEIITGAVLTQNVSWSNVYKCILNLKNNNIVTPWNFIDHDANQVREMIKPSGYYNQKYKKLIFLISYFLDNNYFTGNIPERDELLSLNGVGEETADSILLYAYNEKKFVIDAYTKRLITRITDKNLYKNYREWQNYFTENIDDDAAVYNEYHALVVKHSVEKCRKRMPECGSCILAQYCAHNVSHYAGYYTKA